MTGSDQRNHGRGESGTDRRGDASADRTSDGATEDGPTLGSVGRRTFLGGLAAGAASVATPVSAQTAPSGGPARQMEALDRGLVAVSTDEGVLVRWRLFGTDPEGVGFNVYRDGQQVTDSPVTDSTNYLDPAGTTDSTYEVAPVVDGTERERSQSVGVLPENFLEIPLNKPADRTHPDDGSTVSYVANDASVGDLTGDGSLDIVLKWSPENAKDNSQEGRTNEVLFDAYTLEGNHLWRIGLGRNVRAGAHYTPFLVYDFDGDGVAEFVVRTADGATDGTGTVIGDPNADYRNDAGRILEGPEYLTVFDGTTGEELVTTDYEPARGDICQWGDCYGNRGDRFLAGVAYLDGERPSIVTARGYYEKSALAAWDFRDGELSRRWTFDTDDGWGDYAGQGNHQLSVADVDGDGYDEIVYGAMVVDHDGTGLHTTGWGHGDALHVGNFDPDREGLEIFMPHEETDSPYGASLRDAETGEIIWGKHTGEDTGRGMIADIDPNHRGAEGWASSGVGAHTVDGEELYGAPSSINSAVWWTGDVRRELLAHDVDYDAGDGDPKLEQWDAGNQTLNLVEDFPGTRTNNYTKGNPCLSGDILGDWREEVLYRTPDSEALRLFLTPYETDRRIHTLLHDSQYRVALAWQNAGYNQPPHPSFYLGTGMEDPERPDVTLVGGDGGTDPSGPTRLDSPTTSETVPPGRYEIVDADSGQVLGVADADDADGADVRLGADEDASHQRWDLRYDGAGTYELTAAHSGKALDVFERSTDPGANLVQWTATGNANQRWHVDPVGSGAYRVVAGNSGLVLGTDGDGSAVQEGWAGESSQRWRLVPVADRTGGAGPITVEGGGADIWSGADAFHYYHASVSGDFDVAVRVDSVEDTNEYAKAGLMVRESLSADAANAMIRRTPSETSVQWRESAGADTVSLTSGGGGRSEVAGGTTDHAWQRLVRSGDRIRAYGSDDGVEWTLLAEVPLSPSDSVHLGLAVTSHAEGTLCAAEFGSLSGVSPTESDDVGDVSVAGSVDSGGSDEDTTPPSAPTGLTVEGSTTSSVDVSWSAASDDTGVAEYVVSVDGQRQTTVGGDATSVTVAGLDAGTTYQVGVSAVDAAGNESDPATVSATTSEDGPDLAPVEGTLPRDIDGDGKHEDFNGNGRLDSDDVVVYFNNYDDPAVTNHTDAYDFNDSGRVDFDDIVELFNML